MLASGMVVNTNIMPGKPLTLSRSDGTLVLQPSADAIEKAAVETDPVAVAISCFAVIGGGFSGVEVAAKSTTRRSPAANSIPHFETIRCVS